MKKPEVDLKLVCGCQCFIHQPIDVSLRGNWHVTDGGWYAVGNNSRILVSECHEHSITRKMHRLQETVCSVVALGAVKKKTNLPSI
jgi:hypothetical protein